MNAHHILLAVLAAVTAPAIRAQFVPGLPEQNGLNPKTATIYIHSPETLFNNDLEQSLGVAIADNGNVIVGWEDDGPDDTQVTYMSAVWTLFNSSGNSIVPDTEVNSTVTQGGPITTKFLSYFRADGTAVPGNTSWGPKIKANWFGSGVGMGATSFSLGAEVPEFAAINLEEGGVPGDFPAVQLLNSNGQPLKIASGVSEAHAQTAGDIRIADWDYLSNGNIVIVGESRQENDIVTKFGGTVPTRHAVFRIVDKDGNEVKPVTLLSETHDRVEMWHGVGVTKNGFGVRFSMNGQATVRFFNNDGTPATGNLDLATLTEKPINAGGGRGEGTGFHGNGNDAYVYAVNGTDENGIRQVWITVFNTNGTVRFSKAATEPELALVNPGRVDAAIDEKGRVLVVFADISGTQGNFPIVMGRLFDATGNPIGSTFHVSERELPDPTALEARGPRVAWRQNLAVIAWESRNSEWTQDMVMAMRIFSTFNPGSIEAAGLTRILPDTPVRLTEANSLSSWEPYASVLGTSHFLIEGSTYAEASADQQRYVVMVQPVTGGAGKLAEGFHADNNAPYSGPINLSRQTGNPGRVAGDKRPGAVNYIVGAEVSAHGFPEFQSDNRWSVNDIYSDINRYAAVQSYALNPATLTPTPLTKLFDPVLGQRTDTFAGNVPEVSRFGGDVVALDNGNFVVVIDDRSNMIAPLRTPTLAIITPTGQIVKEGFAVKPETSGEIWANVAAYKGGFAVRFQGVFYFFDNAGALQGTLEQASSGEAFDAGRGDGTRIAAHINSPFVFLAGQSGTEKLIKVAAFDSRTRTAAGSATVSEPALPGGFDRVNLAVDALNRVTVAWESQPAGFVAKQVVARVLAYDATAKTFTPLTPSFLAFVNALPGAAIRAHRMTVAMTTREILIAAKGEINLQNKPEEGPTSPTDLNYYTIFSHPDPKADPTPPVGSVGGGARLSITRSGSSITITWIGDGFTLQSAPEVTGPWSNLTTTGNSHTVTLGTGNAFYRLFKQQ